MALLPEKGAVGDRHHSGRAGGSRRQRSAAFVAKVLLAIVTVPQVLMPPPHPTEVLPEMVLPVIVSVS